MIATTSARFKPAYAYIIYEVDSKREIVCISDIKDFNPVDQFAFKKDQTVQVLYRYKNVDHEPEYYAARILKLGLTREILQEDIEKRRVPVPKIFAEDKDELSFEDLKTSSRSNKNKEIAGSEKASTSADARKQSMDKKKTAMAVNVASLAAAKANHKKRPREEDSSSEEEVLVTKKYLNTIIKKSNENATAIIDIKKRLRSLEKCTKKLTNMDLKTVIEPVDTVVAQNDENGNTFIVPLGGRPDPIKMSKEDVEKIKIEDDLSSVQDLSFFEEDNMGTMKAVAEKVSVDPEVDPEVEPKAEPKEADTNDEVPECIKNYCVPKLTTSQLATLAKNSGNNKKWIKDLTSFVFPPEMLHICSFSGQGSNRNKKTVLYPALPEAGKQFIIDTYEKKLKDGGCRDMSVFAQVEQTVKSMVNEKCSASRRTAKKPEGKKLQD